MDPAYLDIFGAPLATGDLVLVEQIPDDLTRGLLDEDIKAIRQCKGRHLEIVGFDDHGNAELEFMDSDNNFHTIWIATSCLRK